MRGQPQPLPPKISGRSALGLFAGIVLGAAVIGICAVVFFFNPTAPGFYPVCVFHQLTGLNCPGCGATRALYALLHGNFLLALKDNALFVLLLAATAVWLARFAFRKMRSQPVTLNVSPTFLWALLIMSGIFAVLRNFPAFSFLSP